MSVITGRYAPSPTGHLHVGNLRTAVLAWSLARSVGGGFVIRVEDIDRQRCRPEFEAQQLADLAAVGLEWDGVPVRQSERTERYVQALAALPTYRCYCSRREIQAAASAPHGAPGAYPGTCRNLDPEVAAVKAAERAEVGMEPAIRLRADVASWRVQDALHGEVTGAVDDVVLRRADGGWAYNLAVVVDDAEQGVTQVVRGDDLLSSAARQAYLADLLGYRAPEYVHVPLVLSQRGKRLAKRDGDVTLRDITAGAAQAWIMRSLGLPGVPVAELPDRLAIGDIPREPVIFG
ncbi:tRNA glutamyl-Q(34) synthetase GluQRS [Corynebacterium sp. TAE3-ERU12]|uniref:tRNA glutamyl-Q(34) synthetase GluQRS n=1 Tax=Corynebacterium sp. TAE3-ERU12 TaxID=2849491 RepID=UPI001C4834FF|nr:tRNA glutamyl-Q(34) synthetase GluQRS [Corynebacterium sp. TAE3-ERU12]MBV7294431.1 tRNA glutamyl-Q(34) synthetase GluQRS [Corynebacterium sp. TAE3-ERU12]